MVMMMVVEVGGVVRLELGIATGGHPVLPDHLLTHWGRRSWGREGGGQIILTIIALIFRRSKFSCFEGICSKYFTDVLPMCMAAQGLKKFCKRFQIREIKDLQSISAIWYS